MQALLLEKTKTLALRDFPIEETLGADVCSFTDSVAAFDYAVNLKPTSVKVQSTSPEP
jgi:hypothetical protein